jgi:hypothetical protein
LLPYANQIKPAFWPVADNRLPWKEATQKQKAAPPGRDGKTQYHPNAYPRLVLAVLLGVVPARLHVMMFGMAGMAVRGVRMMRRLLVIAGFVMLGGLPMMPGRMLMVLGGLVVMLHALMLAHISLPV